MLNSVTVKDFQTRCRTCGSRDVQQTQRIYFYCFSCQSLEAEIEKIQGENTDRSTESRMPDFGFSEEPALTK